MDAPYIQFTHSTTISERILLFKLSIHSVFELGTSNNSTLYEQSSVTNSLSIKNLQHKQISSKFKSYQHQIKKSNK
jgi:hypothetical protein